MRDKYTFSCPFCSADFGDDLKKRNLHIIKMHRNEIYTDYDDATGEWHYWTPKKDLPVAPR